MGTALPVRSLPVFGVIVLGPHQGQGPRRRLPTAGPTATSLPREHICLARPPRGPAPTANSREKPESLR